MSEDNVVRKVGGSSGISDNVSRVYMASESLEMDVDADAVAAEVAVTVVLA